MRTIRSLILFALCASLLALPACSGGGGGDPCDGWTCSGYGDCVVVDGAASCDCDPFYAPSADGTECVSTVDNPCQGITCSGHGRCLKDAEDQPYCDCEYGYATAADGLDCLENTCGMDCGSMGCCGDRCCIASPTNAAVIGGLEATGLSRTASGAFDTENDCAAGSALGDCELVAVSGGVDICVCRLDSLNVSGSLRLTGAPALAVLASDSISVGGTLDLAARMDAPGAGALVQLDEEAGTYYGGKGGSNGSAGGSSGDPARPASLAVLEGGQNGQSGCGGRSGGGGGGAVQLVAGTAITIGGAIHAGGGGGIGGQADADDQCLGAGGGGSGGSILLEAPQVTISGDIYANGGSGGGGGNNLGASGEDGRDASNSLSPVSGGQGRDGAGCAFFENIEGGDGGAGAAGAAPAEDGQAYDSNACPDLFPYVGGGGGGGGIGRLRINARSDCACTGTFSPAPSTGFLAGQ